MNAFFKIVFVLLSLRSSDNFLFPPPSLSLSLYIYIYIKAYRTKKTHNGNISEEIKEKEGWTILSVKSSNGRPFDGSITLSPLMLQLLKVVTCFFHVIIIIMIIIIILLLFSSWEFSTSALADGLSLESEWQQVSSSHQDSSQCSGCSQ